MKKALIILPLLIVISGCFQTKTVDYSDTLRQIATSVNEIGQDVDTLTERVDDLEQTKDTIDTSTWKKYSNSTYSFEISYPEEYVMTESTPPAGHQPRLSLRIENINEPTQSHGFGPEDLVVEMQVNTQPPRKDGVVSLQAVLEEQNQSTGLVITTLNGKQAIKGDNTINIGTSYQLINNNMLYTIAIAAYPQYDSVVNAILKSFEFTK